MKVIIYTNENGGVSICQPTNELSIEEVKAKDCPEHAIIVDVSDLPQSEDDFFNSWELIDGKVIVNLDKAKAQTKTRLRAEREPQLLAQDVLFQRALESNSGTSAIVAEKQRLRDITNSVDSCVSTDELRAISVEE